MNKPALRCPACEAPLRLATSPKPGQRVRCPKCKEVFRVPAPEEVEPELVEEEKTEAIADRRGDETTPYRPGRKGREEGDEVEVEADEEEVEWDDEVGPQRKRKRIPRVMWIVLAGAILIGGVAVYKFVIKGALGQSVQLGVGRNAKDQAELFKQMIAVHKEQSYHYRRIHSVADAEKRRARLRDLQTELNECLQRRSQLGQVTSPEMEDLNREVSDSFFQALEDADAAAKTVPEARAIIKNP